MLQSLLGSLDAERVLLYLSARGSGYGREIAEFWQTNSSGIQRQLDKLEAGGVLTGEAIGRTKVYRWNERWPFHTELKALIQKATSLMPDQERTRLLDHRRRPRRLGKPLETAR